MIIDVLLFLLLIGVSGYCITAWGKKLDTLERITLGFGFGLGILAAAGLVLGVLGQGLQYAGIILFIPIAAVLAKKKLPKPKIPRILVYLFIIALLLRVVLQLFAPLPITGDEIFHMQYARSFTMEPAQWTTTNFIDNFWQSTDFPRSVDYRPPFFNFAVGSTMSLFGTGFMTAKLFNCFLGALLIFPVFLLGKKLISERVGTYAAMLVAFSPVLIDQALGSEVRIMGAFLALTALYFFLKGRGYWGYSAIFVGLLFLTRQAETLILLLFFLAYIIIKDRKELFRIQNIYPILIVLIIISPWLARNQVVFGSPMYSSSSSVWLMTDIEGLSALEPPGFEPDSRFLLIKGANIYRTFLPFPYYGGSLDFNFVENTNLNYQPVSAVLGLPLALLAIIYLLISLMRKRDDVIFLYTALGLIVATLVVHFSTALTYNMLFPQVVLLSIAGLAVFDRFKKDRRKIVALLIVAGLAVQVVALVPRFSPPQEEIYPWITANTANQDILMSRECLRINYMTERKCYATPYEDTSTIISFAREHGVRYWVVAPSDRRLRDINENTLSAELTRISEVGGFEVWEVS